MVEFNAQRNSWAPSDALVRKARLWVEKRCAARASAIVFCTNGARKIFIDRYGAHVVSRCHVVGNGFDERAFSILETKLIADTRKDRTDGLVLVHSGIIYPTEERDPTAFLVAVARLKAEGVLRAGIDKIIFRATGHDALIQSQVDAHGVSDLISIQPSIRYTDAIAEIIAADGLLLFQGYTSDPAIPAKAYEYIRAGRPILAMVSSSGDTAALLTAVGVKHCPELSDASAIELSLRDFISGLRSNSIQGVRNEVAVRFSREARAQELAGILNTIMRDIS